MSQVPCQAHAPSHHARALIIYWYACYNVSHAGKFGHLMSLYKPWRDEIIKRISVDRFMLHKCTRGIVVVTWDGKIHFNATSRLGRGMGGTKELTKEREMTLRRLASSASSTTCDLSLA